MKLNKLLGKFKFKKTEDKVKLNNLSKEDITADIVTQELSLDSRSSAVMTRLTKVLDSPRYIEKSQLLVMRSANLSAWVKIQSKAAKVKNDQQASRMQRRN